MLAVLLVGGTIWALRVRSTRSLSSLEVPAIVSVPQVASSTSSPSPDTPPPLPTNDFFAPTVTYLEGINVATSSAEVNGVSDLGIRRVPAPPAITPPELVTDVDQDGLNSDQENQLGTDPAKADTDRDDLSDGDEVKKFRTDPLKADTDGDGYSDAQEIGNGYNPLGTGKCLTTDCTF